MMECHGSSYSPPSYVEHLHSLPRLDFHFSTYHNMTFEPKEATYWEGVGMWGLIFACFGFLLLVGVLLYLICRACCCRQHRGYSSLVEPDYKRARCRLCLFAGCAIAVVGVVVYGAAASSYEGQSLIAKTKDVRSKFSQVELEVGNLISEIEENIVSPMVTLKAIASDIEIIEDIIDRAEGGVEELATAWSKLQKIDIDAAVNVVNKYTSYWEYGSLPAVSWLALVAVMFTFGVCCCTKSSVRLAIILALVGIIIAFITGAVAFCLALAGSDFCMAPDYYVIYYASDVGPEGTVSYYVCCAGYESPYEEEFNVAHEMTVNITILLTQLKEQVKDVPNELELVKTAGKGLEKANMSLSQIVEDASCQKVTPVYHDARRTICENGIVSLIILCASATTASVIFVILIACGCRVLSKFQEFQWFNTRYHELSPERDPLNMYGSSSVEGGNSRSQQGTWDRGWVEEETTTDRPPTYQTFRPNDGSSDQ